MTNISHLFAIPEDISQPYRCTNQVYTYTINIHVHLASRQICLIWKVYESIHVSVQYKMKYNRVNYCICTDQTSLQSFTNKYLTYTSILPIQSILQRYNIRQSNDRMGNDRRLVYAQNEMQWCSKYNHIPYLFHIKIPPTIVTISYR